VSFRAAALLIVLASVLPAGTARARAAADRDDAAEARKQFERGAALTAERKYPEAAAAFKASYELRPRKEALFAWAQVARLGGDCPAAIDLYRKFLASAELKPEQIEAAQLGIERCQNAPAPEPPPPAPVVAPPPVPTPAPVPTLVVTEPRRSRGAVVLGASLMSGAVLALGASGVFYYLARQDESAATAAGRWDDYYPSASRARTRQRWALGLAGGGVLLAGAAVVEWLATAPGEPEGTRVTAWLAPGAAGLAIGGRY
jgi:hypothetical protein